MGGNVYKMKKGDLFIARPFTYHSVKVIDKSVPYERFVFNFSEDFIPNISKDFFKNARDVYNVPTSHPIYGVMEEWKRICLANTSKDIEETQKELFKTIITLMSTFVTEKEIKPLKTNKLIEKILAYIDDHPTEKISAKHLSDKFFVSTSWIIHTFKKHLDISLMDYVNKKRAIYAQFLINNGLSPTQACEQCNYTDYSTFYRQYKKFLNCVPKKDKKQD
jgi:YesN/AraC family two-component response regulator